MSTQTPAAEARRLRLALTRFWLIAATLIVLGLMSVISSETIGKTRAGEIVRTSGPRARQAPHCVSRATAWLTLPDDVGARGSFSAGQ